MSKLQEPVEGYGTNSISERCNGCRVPLDLNLLTPFKDAEGYVLFLCSKCHPRNWRKIPALETKGLASCCYDESHNDVWKPPKKCPYCGYEGMFIFMDQTNMDLDIRHQYWMCPKCQTDFDYDPKEQEDDHLNNS